MPTIKLKFIGRSRALQQQYSILQFEIVERRRPLNVGAPVTVIASHRRAGDRHRAAARGAGAGAERADRRVQPQGARGVRAAAGAHRALRQPTACWSRAASRRARRSSCATRRCSTRCGEEGAPMFNLLVDGEPEEPAAGAGGGRRAGGLRQLRAAAPARRRLPRPQPPDRGADDRGRGPGAAGGRAARHLSDRDRHGRHAGRRARALGLRRRPVDRLRRVRLGDRDLPRPAAGGRAARDRAGPAAARRAAADGADLLDHGRDHAGRGHRAVGLAHGAARDRRFRHPPADPDHPRRCPGHPDRRRGAPVPRHARPGDDEPARDLARRASRPPFAASASTPAAASSISTRAST